ncbi:MAG: CbiX/SirB N-terminal domain-containing protein [Bacteroidales bacterium]|jgi:sirohydrochlorin cobaltochelatase|nr:CbiX/SirB N-terminal domain-containing protein [Bacteroidales bacterium]
MAEKSLIILGHGSRSKDAQEEFSFIVDTIKNKVNYKEVAGAYMEISEPSLEDTVEKLYNGGSRDIIILPYFLFTGIHIKEDIPEILEKLQNKFEGIKLTFGTPFGKEELIADILIKKANEL